MKAKLIIKKNNINKLMKRLTDIHTKVVETGYFSSQGKHSTSDVGYAQMASWLEFGTKTNRAYPLFHRTVEFFERPSESKVIKSALTSYFTNLNNSKKYTQVLTSIGSGYAEIIQSGMGNPSRTGNSNAPSTITRKGSNTPWVDTQELKQNISYRFNGKVFAVN